MTAIERYIRDETQRQLAIRGLGDDGGRAKEEQIEEQIKKEKEKQMKEQLTFWEFLYTGLIGVAVGAVGMLICIGPPNDRD